MPTVRSERTWVVDQPECPNPGTTTVLSSWELQGRFDPKIWLTAHPRAPRYWGVIRQLDSTVVRTPRTTRTTTSKRHVGGFVDRLGGSHGYFKAFWRRIPDENTIEFHTFLVAKTSRQLILRAFQNHLSRRTFRD